MGKKMSAKKFVQTVLVELEPGDPVPSAADMREDWGVFISRDARAKDAGPNVFTIGGSYYYKSQCSTPAMVRDLVNAGPEHGFTVTPLSYHGATELPVEPDALKCGIFYDTKSWPTESFGKLLVRVEADA